MITLHQHTAEILALAVSPDESQIFASGVDSRVTCIQKVVATSFSRSEEVMVVTSAGVPKAIVGPTPSDNNWVYSTSHRPHSHDVLALAICNSHKSPSGGAEASATDAGDDDVPLTKLTKGKGVGIGGDALLISGGLDCKLCAYSVNDFAAIRPSVCDSSFS